MLVSLILFIVGIVTMPGDSSPSPSQTKPSATVGSEATISAPNLDTVYLAVDKDAFDLWVKASVSKDYIGMQELESLGKVFPVPNGTKVLVIDSAFTARQVRVLEGNAYGRSGWLPYEWVK
jgi:hypothetical protein